GLVVLLLEVGLDGPVERLFATLVVRAQGAAGLVDGDAVVVLVEDLQRGRRHGVLPAGECSYPPSPRPGRRSVIVPGQRWSPRIIQCNQLSGGHVMAPSNEYLNQVVAEQAQVEGELKARKQAPPARGRGIFNRLVAVRRVVGAEQEEGGGDAATQGHAV